MTDKELFIIGNIIQTIPAFEDLDTELLPSGAEDCAGLLGEKMVSIQSSNSPIETCPIIFAKLPTSSLVRLWLPKVIFNLKNSDSWRC